MIIELTKEQLEQIDKEIVRLQEVYKQLNNDFGQELVLDDINKLKSIKSNKAILIEL